MFKSLFFSSWRIQMLKYCPLIGQNTNLDSFLCTDMTIFFPCLFFRKLLDRNFESNSFMKEDFNFNAPTFSWNYLRNNFTWFCKNMTEIFLKTTIFWKSQKFKCKKIPTTDCLWPLPLSYRNISEICLPLPP